jgi:kinesin family protein 6/9
MSNAQVKVFIRAKPTTQFAGKNIKMDEEKGDITITIPKRDDQGIVNHQQEHWSFKFDKILLNVSQEVLFAMTVKDIVSNSLEGYSGTVLAYGQTGAGKTFSILGSATEYKYRGLIPRTISALYQEIQTRYEKQIKVRVSYIEIYNENLNDLLSSSQNHDLNTNCVIQEDPVLGVHVKGATMALVTKSLTVVQH